MDVVVCKSWMSDFDSDANSVSVSGARGFPPSDSYKVPSYCHNLYLQV